MRFKDVQISPRTIEATAITFAIAVLIVGGWASLGALRLAGHYRAPLLLWTEF